MFRIGEFAQIAQVSARQLRHYDQLGLLRPDHTDQQSGYRYYSIRQLQRLNRILALKDLGLSLEQIRPLLEDQISSAELRGMLTMRRAQVEQSLQAEEARLRHIDSRIAEIDRQGRIEGYDVVVKPVAAMPFVSLRRFFDGMDEVVPVLSAIAEEGTKQIPASLRDKLMVVARNDEESEKLDLEIGFSLVPAHQCQLQPFRRLCLAGERASRGSSHGDHRQIRDQCGKSFVLCRHRHLDRGPSLPDRRCVPGSLSRADHRPARTGRRAGRNSVSRAPRGLIELALRC